MVLYFGYYRNGIRYIELYLERGIVLLVMQNVYCMFITLAQALQQSESEDGFQESQKLVTIMNVAF